MTEAKFQTKFNLWCKYNWLTTARFELKITDKKSLPFSAVKEHQEQGLRNHKVIYKLPDSDPSQKPFDSMCLVDVQGYVVVMFYKRGCKDFYMFKIEDWLLIKKDCGRKSITEEMAMRYGIKYTMQ